MISGFTRLVTTVINDRSLKIFHLVIVNGFKREEDSREELNGEVHQCQIVIVVLTLVKKKTS